VTIALAAMAGLPGCGGGGGGNVSGPSGGGTQRDLLGSQSWQLVSPAQAQAAGLAIDMWATPIQTNVTGDLEVTVDWTSGNNDVDIAIVRGNCTPQQGLANACGVPLAESTSTTAKPERATARGVAAGAYTLLIANWGPGQESGTLQVFLTH
jgi:hypothetical protein